MIKRKEKCRNAEEATKLCVCVVKTCLMIKFQIKFAFKEVKPSISIVIRIAGTLLVIGTTEICNKKKHKN